MSQLDKLIHVGEDYLRFISSLTSQQTAAHDYETAFIDCVKAFEDKALPAESKFLYGYMGLQKNTPCQIGSARSLELLEQSCKEGYIPAALFLSELYQKSRDLIAPAQEPDYYYQLLADPIVKGHPHALYLRAKFLGEEWVQAPHNSMQKESLGMQAQIAKKFLEDLGYCGSDHLSHIWGNGGGPGPQFLDGHEALLRRVMSTAGPTDIFMKNIIVDSQFRLGVILYDGRFVDRQEVEGLDLIRSAAGSGHEGAQAWLEEYGLKADEESGQKNAGPMSYFKKSSSDKINDAASTIPPYSEDEKKDETYRDLDVGAQDKKDPPKDFEYVWDSETKKTFRVHKPKLSIYDKPILTVDDILAPLDGLIGIDDIRAEIRQIVEYSHAVRLRQNAGLNSRPLNLHCVFAGAPGTGKTTVARLLGTILHVAGILRTGQVVEVDCSDLIARYIGNTTSSTKAALKAAAGGILFVDEAYAISEVDYYGEEFVNTMVKYMEDHAADTMVIVAGYTARMDQFMQANPGFRSRFSKTMYFPDLNASQLLPVFMKLCDAYDYTLSPFAMKRLEVALATMKKKEGPRFGNGRSVRNLFDDIIKRQARRVVLNEIDNRDDLMVITAGDISFADDEGGDDVITLSDRKRKS